VRKRRRRSSTNAMARILTAMGKKWAISSVAFERIQKLKGIARRRHGAAGAEKLENS
jgi:hypothetical protein